MKLRGRRKRRIRFIAVSIAAAVLLAAAAYAYFGTELFRPASPSFTPEPTPNWDAPVPTPGETSPAPEETPPVSPSPDETEASVREPLTRSLYEVALTVFANEQQPYLKGSMRLTYVNDSKDTLYEVKLRLYPNDVSPGCMSVSDVACEDEAAFYTLEGENKSLLNIRLTDEVAPGGMAEVFLNFNIALVRTGNRFGVNSTGIMLGNALPIAAVYENGAWRADAYSGVGDAFYSACADYRVAVNVPANWRLAHTGSLIEQTNEDGVSTWYIAAANVREFAMALMNEPSVDMRWTDEDVAIRAYGTNRYHAMHAADAALAALNYFNEKIGSYPYDTFYVVPFDMSGGMEYPGLVMVCADYLRDEELTEAALVIGHETAHQWFYGVVGSDQINAPWLDESLVEYLGFDFLRSYLGEKKADKMRDERFAALTNYNRAIRIDASLYEFPDKDYFYVVYACGYRLYDELYNKLGPSAFYGALSTYFNAHSFAIAGKEDIIAAFSEAAGEDLSDWFEQRLAVAPGAAS